MNKPVKLPEIRKEAFTRARESLGLSAKELSGMACLSVRQIQQIENGESSTFYSAQVKFTAAKKVAGLLKLKPEDAFDFGDLVQHAKSVEVEEKLPEETKASLAEKKKKSEKVKEEKEGKEEKETAPIAKTAELKPEQVSPSKISESILDYRVQSKVKEDPKKKLFLLLVIGGALVFSAVNLRSLVFPEPVKKELVIIQEPVPEPVPAVEPVADAKQASAAIPSPTPVAVSMDCPPADPSALNYKPDAPKKSGDRVFLQSKTAQTVCVVDASGKTQNKTLEPDIGVSIFGKPPLKVLTDGLNQVDLYFQGAKVRIGNTTSKTIILEASEIIQPLTPPTSADTQLR